MARALALAVVVVVVLVGGTCAFHSYGTPLMFFPPSFYNAPNYFEPYPYSTSAESIQAIRIAMDISLPCPAEGFYTNPSNCSQFYRCVDHVGTGQWFVRYIFECPSGHFFVAQVATCLPGSCDGTQQPVLPPQPPVQPVTPVHPITPMTPITPIQPVTPVQPVQPPVQPITPTVQPVQPPQPTVQPTNPPTSELPTTQATVEDTQPPVETTMPPVQPTDPPQPPPVPPQPPTQPPQQPSPDCIGQYIQNEKFCNAYSRCNETGVRYICPPGTAFDEPRQMCRISAGDETLCVGKSIAAFPYFLRTELVDGHLLLPDDYVLTPLNPFAPQTSPLHAPGSPPFQFDLRNQPIPPPIPASLPANSPSLSLGTQPNPAFSQSPSASPPISGSYPAGSSSPSLKTPPNPAFSQPGSPSSPSFGTYKPPSQSPFPASSPSLTFTGNQSPFSPFSSFPADTQSLPALSSIPQQSFSVYSYQPVPSPYSRPIGAPSPNNVRRPFGHLHFPQYAPYSLGIPEYTPYYAMDLRR